jgi:hypothetical protein
MSVCQFRFRQQPLFAQATVANSHGNEYVVHMVKLAKSLIALMVLALAVYLPMTNPSSATSAELAKKCRAMAIKAHPNPIPGSKASGAEKAEREYFQACIAKDGKMENN